MKLEQLTYFLETARNEHIGKAAKVLAISPSAISHSISQLEEELGRELFIKKGKRIYLSPHGKILMERAEQLLRQVQILKEELSSEQVELQGHFRLAASHDLCSSYLAAAWADLQKEHKKLTSEIYTLRSAQVVAGVISREFDMGLCFNPVSHPDLSSKIIRSGSLVITFAKDHSIWKKKESERLSFVSQYPAVLPKAFQGIEVCDGHPVFEKFKIKAVPDCLIDCYAVGVSKVAESESWGFMPDWIVESHSDKLRAIKPPPGWDAKYQVAIVWVRDRLLSEALRQLMENSEKRLLSK